MAGLNRNQWPLWIGISGRFASECAETATMAVNELLQGLIGHRSDEGWAAQRIRRFDLGIDRLQGAKQHPGCILCVDQGYWGRGDVAPFLDRVE